MLSFENHTRFNHIASEIESEVPKYHCDNFLFLFSLFVMISKSINLIGAELSLSVYLTIIASEIESEEQNISMATYCSIFSFWSDFLFSSSIGADTVPSVHLTNIAREIESEERNISVGTSFSMSSFWRISFSVNWRWYITFMHLTNIASDIGEFSCQIGFTFSCSGSQMHWKWNLAADPPQQRFSAPSSLWG